MQKGILWKQTVGREQDAIVSGWLLLTRFRNNTAECPVPVIRELIESGGF
jgi:hypothetical protein